MMTWTLCILDPVTGPIWQEYRSDVVPILEMHINWPGSFCFLPLGGYLDPSTWNIATML